MRPRDFTWDRCFSLECARFYAKREKKTLVVDDYPDARGATGEVVEDATDDGDAGLAEESLPGIEDAESPFEDAVYTELTRRGFTVHSQAGCSGYRIDLGVVHPKQPGYYVLGIECDGANYTSAKTARDRDRLRELVLARLGWTLHRAWSTDWWRDPKRQADKIEEAVRKAAG